MAVTRNTYSIFAAAVLALLCSCTKDQGPVVPQEESAGFVLATKAEAQPGTEFRILAYGCSETDHFNVVTEGTYSFEGKTLGEFPYLTASEPLVVPFEQVGNSFYVSYVSPATEHTNGSFTTDLAQPFYSSDVQKVQLYNYGLVEMTNPLYDRRAKIGFKFIKAQEAAENEIEITDVAIVGAGNIYWPASKQVTGATEENLLAVTLNPVAEDGNLQIYECKEFDAMPFVLSGIYAPKDTVAAHLQKDANYALEFAPTNLQETGYLMVQFNMYVNGGGPLLVTAPLTYNAAADMALDLNPLTTYMYNITVSETYIKTILEVTPLNSWEDVEFGWEIKDNTEKVYLGDFTISPDGWESEDWNDCIIKSSKN